MAEKTGLESILGMTIKDATDRKPILLARVSSPKQFRGMSVQVEALKTYAKNQGFTKTPIVIQAQTSGYNADRVTVVELKDVIENGIGPNGRKVRGPFVVIVRDLSRLGRTHIEMLELVQYLTNAGVALIPMSFNRVVNSSDADMLSLYVLIAVNAHGKKSEERAREEAQRESRARGIPRGSPTTVYYNKRSNDKTVHQQIYDAEKPLVNGTISRNKLSEALQAQGPPSAKGPLPQAVTNIREKLKSIEARGGKAKLREYLDVVRRISDLERSDKGLIRSGATMTNKAKALHRVTHGYLKEPFDWPHPFDEGNDQLPTDTSERGKPGRGTVADALENKNRYLPRR